jgi:ABC-type glycerol-3-phosphate transport system permease component
VELIGRGRLARYARRAVVAAAITSVLIPLLWIVRIALRPVPAYIGDPAGLGGGVTLDNVVTAWNSGVGASLIDSAVVVTMGATLASVLATLAGYAMAKFDFPGRTSMGPFIATAIITPPAALVIPLFDQSLQLGTVNSRIGLALVYGALFSAWGTFFMRSYFAGLPDELLESASVDGASAMQTFLRVSVPLAAPAIATLVVLNVFLQWSELIIALVLLPSPQRQTAIVAAAQFATQFRTGGPLSAAAMLLATAPIVLVFAVGQRWLRADVLAGSVKS